MLALIGAAASFFHVPLGAQEATLDEVLARATQYVVDYQQALSGVVSEERYLQTWRRGPRQTDTRVLASDVLLTRPTGAKRYVLFRDVFEVDGRQVRDRSERLLQLFLSPSASTSQQVTRILDEGARYNLGDILRTVNTPTLALVFLDPLYQSHFKFTRSDDRTVEMIRGAGDDGAAAPFAVGDDLWVLAYEETARETLLYTGSGLEGNLPARGRFWVEPATGRIIVTEMHLRNRVIDALIDVRYDLAEAVGAFVPIAMRERYRDLRRSSLIEGDASYRRFRKFQVSATEAIDDPTPSEGAAPGPTP